MKDSLPLFRCPLKLAILGAMSDEVEHTVSDLERETGGDKGKIGAAMVAMQRRGWVDAPTYVWLQPRRWRITTAGKVALMVAKIPQLA